MRCFGAGILPETDYEQLGPVAIAPGDLLVIGTDGIWEARNAAGEMFGKQRFHALLLKHAEQSAHTIYEAVVNAVKAHTDTGGPDDDVTLVIVKGT